MINYNNWHVKNLAINIAVNVITVIKWEGVDIEWLVISMMNDLVSAHIQTLRTCFFGFFGVFYQLEQCPIITHGSSVGQLLQQVSTALPKLQKLSFLCDY